MKKPHSADYEGNPDIRIVSMVLFKSLITSRKSIPHLSNAEFGLKNIKKTKHDGYSQGEYAVQNGVFQYLRGFNKAKKVNWLRFGYDASLKKMIKNSTHSKW